MIEEEGEGGKEKKSSSLVFTLCFLCDLEKQVVHCSHSCSGVFPYQSCYWLCCGWYGMLSHVASRLRQSCYW